MNPSSLAPGLVLKKSFLMHQVKNPLMRLRLVALVMVAQSLPRTPPSSSQDSIISGEMLASCVSGPM